MTLNSAIAGLGLLDVATFVILNAVLTDVLVRRLYASSPNIWESIGRPVGPLWVPPRTRARDTLTIFERRISISEMHRRVSASFGAIDTLNIVKLYYRLHKIAVFMIMLGSLIFLGALIWGFLN